jgi:hypothetical protein
MQLHFSNAICNQRYSSSTTEMFLVLVGVGEKWISRLIHHLY